MFAQMNIGFIGGGNMGEALIRGILGASLFTADRVHVFDVSAQRMDHLRRTYSLQAASDIAAMAETCQILVIAVKPQNIVPVFEGIRQHLSHKPIVVSIAAGIALSTISQALPEGPAIVRVMPNAPALVLQGASALSRGPKVSDGQMELVLSLFRSVGSAVEVDEKWMDAITGLSGSGPGYILLVIESLIEAGVLLGIPRQISKELVVQTVVGTALMAKETGKHPTELKDIITSPGGTTIRGLQVLEDEAVRGAFMRAVEAATQRSIELGKK